MIPKVGLGCSGEDGRCPERVDGWGLTFRSASARAARVARRVGWSRVVHDWGTQYFCVSCRTRP